MLYWIRWLLRSRLGKHQMQRAPQFVPALWCGSCTYTQAWQLHLYHVECYVTHARKGTVNNEHDQQLAVHAKARGPFVGGTRLLLQTLC